MFNKKTFKNKSNGKRYTKKTSCNSKSITNLFAKKNKTNTIQAIRISKVLLIKML